MKDHHNDRSNAGKALTAINQKRPLWADHQRQADLLNSTETR